MNLVTLIGNVQSIEAWREGARVELLVTEPDGTTGTYPVERACGRCGRRLPTGRYVYSRYTGRRYCWPGEGCAR